MSYAFIIPRENELIIDSIQLHVLQSPTFIDSTRYGSFTYTSQIRSMEHADLDSPLTKFLDEGSKKGSTRWFRRLARSAKSIGEYRQSKFWIFPQCIPDSRYLEIVSLERRTHTA